MEELLSDLLVNNFLTVIVASIATGISGFLGGKLTILSKRERARLAIDICQTRETIFNAYEKYVLGGHPISSARYDNLMKLGDAYTKDLHQNSTAGQYLQELRSLRPYLVTD